jgi:hypothetical protein
MDNTREKLIELIQCSPADIMGGHGVGALAGHLIANGVTVQKWIPVTERLPKHCDFILCYLICDEISVCQWNSIAETWIANTWDYTKNFVTHWMPLPEAPKEVSE